MRSVIQLTGRGAKHCETTPDETAPGAEDLDVLIHFDLINLNPHINCPEYTSSQLRSSMDDQANLEACMRSDGHQ